MSNLVTVTPVTTIPVEPVRRTSNIMSWWQGINKANQITQSSNYVREGVHAFRSLMEAFGTGGILGLVDAERGSLDISGIPIDGVVAGLGFLGSLYFANDPYGISLDMRNIGSDAFSVLAYRKAKEWRQKGKIESPKSHTTDPIVAAAANL